ncbi:MAG: tRNA(Ile)-lysidine synthetase [Labilithrix sp.]|nr:tRNA(Ile)-lysidine synthetase [Labilithrix sp.]
MKLAERRGAPSLLTIARRALAGEAALPAGTRVLVAASGGPDSAALLHVLARLASTFAIEVVAHGVDHGLRPEAGGELDLAEALAASLGVPFTRSTVRLAKGGNLQARARAARYEALAVAARAAGASVIATAHHADDRAETVLLRLLRGAGPRGLAVLPPRAPLAATELGLVRPLLRARRASIEAHLGRHGISFASDPSNLDSRYARARVRAELLPLLAALSPGIVDHLTALADQLTALTQDDEAQAASATGLPRATQTALAELMRTRSRTARVWLPGDLVVRYEPKVRAAREP